MSEDKQQNKRELEKMEVDDETRVIIAASNPANDIKLKKPRSPK